LQKPITISVRSESDQSELLYHEVRQDTAYQRQGDNTIITWSDKEAKTDVALSFQEFQGCSEVWQQINELAGQEFHWQEGPESYHSQTGIRDENTNPMILSGMSGVDTYQGSGYYGPLYEPNLGQPGALSQQVRETALDFPDPRLDTISSIASSVTKGSVFQREAVANQLLKPGYLNSILECFSTAEDLEDDEAIKAANRLITGAILLNDANLLELMFSERHVVQVVAALEYDPHVPEEARVRHRDHVKGTMSLKEVVPILDPICRAKIMQSYRIAYVKDVMLAKSLDDATYATLSSLQLFSTVEVLLSLQGDKKFFPDLFARIAKAEKGTEEWRDLIAFLQELISLSKHIQASQRNTMLLQLCNLGLFQILGDVLESEDGDAKLRAIDALLATAVHDPALLRSHIQNNERGSSLFGLLINGLVQRSLGGLQEQCLDVIKVLMDPDTMENTDAKDKFIDLFYDAHISRLMEIVCPSTATQEAYPSNHRDTTTLLLIIELLCYCVSQHSYRIKYYILRNNAVEKVLRLLSRPEKAVAASALRFLKTCVAMKDEFYNRYLVKNSLLEPILTAYLKHCRRENLIHSAILEFFDFLRKENMKSLLSAVVQSSLWSKMEEVDKDRDFLLSIRMKHELNLDAKDVSGVHADMPVGPEASAMVAEHCKQEAVAKAMEIRGEKKEDIDEDSYFREDEQELENSSIEVERVTGQIILEGSPPLQGMPPRLVDYDDDDEEDTIPLGVIGKAKRKSNSSSGAIKIVTEKKAKPNQGPDIDYD
jgi:protein phosphatase-4 regulatory subunit 3